MFIIILAFQYNMMMRIGMLEDAVDNMSQQLMRLGERVEPTDSIFHFNKMETLEEWDQLEASLLIDQEFKTLTVSIYFFV